jgi:hypothetical protein
MWGHGLRTCFANLRGWYAHFGRYAPPDFGGGAGPRGWFACAVYDRDVRRPLLTLAFPRSIDWVPLWLVLSVAAPDKELPLLSVVVVAEDPETLLRETVGKDSNSVLRTSTTRSANNRVGFLSVPGVAGFTRCSRQKTPEILQR